MYRAGLESILGLRRRGDTSRSTRACPRRWPDYTHRWRVGDTRYEITVDNPLAPLPRRRRPTLDGAAGRRARGATADDGRTHDA